MCITNLAGYSESDTLRRYDAYLPVPARMPETRHTTYDQVVHLLTAIVHDLTPLYARVTADPNLLDVHEDILPDSSPGSRASPRRSRSTNDILLEENGLGPRITTLTQRRPTSKGVIALCHRTIDVVHCPSLRGDIPQLECEQIVRLSDSGKVSVKAASHLASAFRLALAVTNVNPSSFLARLSTSHSIS